MQLSASILGIKENFKENVIKLSNTSIDYIHLDIMDGDFVNQKTWNSNELEFIKELNKPLDVHLMVNDIYKYIDDFVSYNPEYITIHYEATDDLYLAIDYIKSYNIKVGVSIKPETDINVLAPFFNLVDLVLIMSVEPGLGGQSFITKTTKKINGLKYIKEKGKYHFKIEVDGGINDINYKEIKADMIVVGSFITQSNNYQEQINKLH